MKRILFILLSQLIWLNCIAQKPPLDLSALKNWPHISGWLPAISNDGRYVSFQVDLDKQGKHTALFIQSTDDKLKWRFDHAADRGQFTVDSRRTIFRKTRDTLCILDFKTGKETDIPNVLSYQMPKQGAGKWLAYSTEDHDLIIMDLSTGKKQEQASVQNFLFDNDGKTLLVNVKELINKSENHKLLWINLQNNTKRVIWQGSGASRYCFGNSEQLAFIAANGAKPVYSIYYYNSGLDSARKWIDDRTAGIDSNFVIANTPLAFSPDGRRLFLGLNRVVKLPNKKMASVDVWNYKDDYPQYSQLEALPYEKKQAFKASIRVGIDTVIFLQRKATRNFMLSNDSETTYAIFATDVNTGAGYRKKNDRPDIYIENTKDGHLKCIAKQVPQVNPEFSYGSKYVLWYNERIKAYFTYNIKTSITTNISKGVNCARYGNDWERPSFPEPYGHGKWLKDDSGILVYDKFDIWLLDPAGIKPPVNITEGYGRAHGIRLRCIYLSGIPEDKSEPLDRNDKIFLAGFDLKNMNNGFFMMNRIAKAVPQKLIMAPELFYFPDPLGIGMPSLMIKARDSDIYILQRMNSRKFPNLQITKDFKNFTAITNLHPESKYNWMTTKLWHWRTFDGIQGNAIIYKPENFDVHKNYPVIFYFYMRLTVGLNKYIEPELGLGPLPIPWFVSNGYVVICPDIHYTNGSPAQSVYNYVVSAAQAISKQPWAGKIGIQGHSFGGYEVNTLITKSPIFSAACEASGVSDLVSYIGIASSFPDPFDAIEQDIDFMKSTLWENPAAYQNNSPIYKADRVVTPLLIMHDKMDQSVPWYEGVEMYSALRRLNKKVWLLQYDNGDHTLDDTSDQIDFTIRLSQFFDHYLKGKPAPKWMVEGIPAAMKQIDSGLELEPGREP